MAKPRKVEEPAAPYLASPKQGVRAAASDPKVHYLDDATAEKLTDKIFAERKNLLRKLAQ